MAYSAFSIGMIPVCKHKERRPGSCCHVLWQQLASGRHTGQFNGHFKRRPRNPLSAPSRVSTFCLYLTLPDVTKRFPRPFSSVLHTGINHLLGVAKVGTRLNWNYNVKGKWLATWLNRRLLHSIFFYCVFIIKYSAWMLIITVHHSPVHHAYTRKVSISRMGGAGC